MTSKKELQLAYGLAIVLLVVGVASYAFTALSPRSEEEPVRIMYRSVAGNVLFDHLTHVAPDTGYGMACADCHHHPADETGLLACGVCHEEPSEEASMPDSCLDCHDADEIEDTEMVKRADAFHNQCIQCHQEVGAGAMECADCHLL